MDYATQDEIIAVATKMAQELQDIIGEAEQAGCADPLPGVKALIDEWEEVFSRTEGNWIKKLEKNNNHSTSLLDSL